MSKPKTLFVHPCADGWPSDTVLSTMATQDTPGKHLSRYLATHTRIQSEGVELMLRLTDSPVMITAPHTKATFRDGSYKRRDENTGVLAMEAGRQAGVCVLLPATPGDADGNWDSLSMFRRTLQNIASGMVVLDVHGMHDGHGPDLVIGTASGGSPPWLVSCAEAASRSMGWVAEVRHSGPLSASPRTVCSFANEHLAGGVQLEIAARHRSPRTDPAAFSRAVDVVAAIASAARMHRAISR